MEPELPSVVLVLRLTWAICSHSSEKYLWIKILKLLPQKKKNEKITITDWANDSDKIEGN